MLFIRHRRIDWRVSQQLDTVRWIAAFLVLFAHAYQILFSSPSFLLLSFVSVLSQLSVMVFFVLSGFLIFKSIGSNVKRNNNFVFKKYMLDRFFRLFPPLFLCLMLGAFLYFMAPLLFPSGSHEFLVFDNVALTKDKYDFSMTDFFGTLLFLNGFFTNTISVNGSLWSLSFEFWFYVLAGLLALGRKYYGVYLALILMVLLSLINFKFLVLSSVWLSGFFVSFLHDHRLRFKSISWVCFFIAAFLTTFFVFLFIKDTSQLDSILNLNHRLVTLVGLSGGVFFSVTLHLLLNEQLELFVFKPSYSSFSYTLYVVHYPILLFSYGFFQEQLISSALFSWSLFGFLVFFIFLVSRLLSFVENFNFKKYFC